MRTEIPAVLTLDLRNRLRCPDDGSALLACGDTLVCPACSRTFPVRDGIPELLAASLVELLDDSGSAQPMDETERALRSEMQARDDESAIYDELYDDRAYRHELATYVREIAVQRDEHVLDLGCGTGRVTKECLASAASVVGADFSMDSLQFFSRRLAPADAARVLLVRCEAGHLPFADGSFDVVVSTSLFSNLPNAKTWDLGLAELARVLAPGGRAMITVYNYSAMRRLRHLLGQANSGQKQGTDGRICYYNFDPAELRAWVGTQLEPGPCFGLNHRVPLLSRALRGQAWRIDWLLDHLPLTLGIFAAEMGVIARKPDTRSA